MDCLVDVLQLAPGFASNLFLMQEWYGILFSDVCAAHFVLSLYQTDLFNFAFHSCYRLISKHESPFAR